MKWDVDKALAELEEDLLAQGEMQVCGTIIQRIVVGTDVMVKHNIKPTDKQTIRGIGTIWQLGLGGLNEPKAFFLDQTIRKVVMKARKEYKLHQRKRADHENRRREKRRANRKNAKHNS